MSVPSRFGFPPGLIVVGPVLLRVTALPFAARILLLSCPSPPVIGLGRALGQFARGHGFVGRAAAPPILWTVRLDGTRLIGNKVPVLFIGGSGLAIFAPPVCITLVVLLLRAVLRSLLVSASVGVAVNVTLGRRASTLDGSARVAALTLLIRLRIPLFGARLFRLIAVAFTGARFAPLVAVAPKLSCTPPTRMGVRHPKAVAFTLPTPVVAEFIVENIRVEARQSPRRIAQCILRGIAKIVGGACRKSGSCG